MFQGKPKIGGFTLIEILVVLGIVSLLVGIGSLVNFSQYTRQVTGSEVSVLVSSLQRARSMSMSNINASIHGVNFDNDLECYYVFEDSYAGQSCAGSGNVKHNENITVTASDGSQQIIFKQLSGEADIVGSAVTLTLVGTGVNTTITIYKNGMIDW